MEIGVFQPALLVTFAIGFFFSFIGTLPPGTISLSIVQLGLKNRIDVAWRMTIAAAITEYPYAWVAVVFQDYLTASLDLTGAFRLLAGMVMVVIGALNLWASAKPSRLSRRFEESGFRKGVLLGLINPLAIPFWMAMTAYLKAHGWVTLADNFELQAYLLGISAGTLVVFMLFAYLARTVVSRFHTSAWLQKAPAILLIFLGLYSFAEYMLG